MTNIVTSISRRLQGRVRPVRLATILLLGIALSACVIQPAIDETSGRIEAAKTEADYVALVCPRLGGVPEYRTSAGTRVDCLTSAQAIEFDWADKWYEGITQALYYAMLTQRQAAVALIEKGPNPQRYIARARALIDFYALPVEVMIVPPDNSEAANQPVHWP